MTARLLATAFAGFLVWIVVMADQGRLYDYIPDPTQYPEGDKICHFLLMGTMALLANLALRGKAVPFAGRRWFVGSVLVFLLVAAEEFSQIFVDGRNFDLVDLTADALGIVLLGNFGGKLAAKR